MMFSFSFPWEVAIGLCMSGVVACAMGAISTFFSIGLSDDEKDWKWKVPVSVTCVLGCGLFGGLWAAIYRLWH